MAMVTIEVGSCPRCGNEVETADGLEHYSCAAAHDAARFRLVGTYEMDAAEAWRD